MVRMDIIVTGLSTDPPFRSIDFRCNGMVLDGDGLRVSRTFELLGIHGMTLSHMLFEIGMKIATVVDYWNYRVTKMGGKGWITRFRQ
jgi:hypothetical protein